TAGTPSTQTTTITADPTTLPADGESTSVITVEVRDDHGNLIGASAGDVELFTSLGTLSAITDHGDGTYTAVLVSGTSGEEQGSAASGRFALAVIGDPPGTGTAIITGTLNG